MIWHIFKKDWKLLWRMAVGVGLIGLIYRVILSSAGRFENGRTSARLSVDFTVGELGLLGIALVVLMVVQMDAIPGLRQDWLVRPILRRDLLLSKLLFVVLAVQMPIFFIEVGQALAAGFSLGQSVGAPLEHSLTMIFAFELPVLALAALTRNLAEAMGAVIVVIVVLALFTTATIGMAMRDSSGVAWVSNLLMTAWGVVAGAVILSVQYYRRKTRVARAIGGLSVGVWLGLILLPWPTAFAIERRFSPDPAAANPIAMSYDTSRAVTSAGGTAGMGVFDLPLRVNGLAEGQILNSERFEVRLKASNGEVVSLGAQRDGRRFIDRWQRVFVPRPVYDRFRDQPVELEINYWVTLLKADAAQGLPAVDGNHVLPGIGACATRVSEGGEHIQLRCVAPGSSPCATWFLRNPLSGAHDEGSSCPADYTPWMNSIAGDALSRFGGDIGVGKFPRALKDAEVMVRVYRPQAHFTTRMTTPAVVLSEWSVK